MKTFLRCVVTVLILLGMHQLSFAQTPNLGRAASFVLFSANGPVSHTGISQISGKVGTNIGLNTGFGNVNGGMHSQDSFSANAATDLGIAYGQIDTVTANYFIASPFGNGDTLITGTYELGAASQLSGNLYLNAQGDSNAYFIIRIQGQMTSAANAKVHLVNGAQACNVYWLVEGAMTMATGTFIRGSFIVNNGAIILNSLDSLEGRLLTTVGAITVNGISANIPKGCGSIALTGPAEFNMGELACYALFSKSGAVTNTGVSRVTGDVGTNVALTTGFDSLLVEGSIHPIPDTSTARAADSLTAMYTFLNTLSVDIELMQPAQFGRNLILTPHVYLLNAATQFDDSLFLDAEGDSNAIFVIKVNGAFTTNSGSKVILRNGAKAEKVYWKIDGALSIASNSFFKGTAVVNNGAINVATGVRVDGRLMTTTGLLNTEADTIRSFQNCSLVSAPVITTEPDSQTVCNGQSALFVVVASGSGLTYQWQRNGVDLVNGGNISGATNDSLSLNPSTATDTSGTYRVIVSGASLPNDTSRNVTLSINATTLITTEPMNQVSCGGDSVFYTVVASGLNLNYQWRRGNVNLVNGANILGVDSNVLVIVSAGNADTAFNYNVIVSGLCGTPDTSVNASLTIGTAIVIGIQPLNEQVCVGDTAHFDVVASGSGLTYQWRRGNVNLVNGVNISGANSANLTINVTSFTDTASDYNVIISNQCGGIDTSNFASLFLATPPTITSEPINVQACTGASVNLAVVATGTGLTYQWRKGSVNLVNGGNISGATSATLIINPTSIADTASNYNVIVFGSCTPNDTSVHVSVTISTPTLITAEPISQIVCSGSSINFAVTATGGGLTYQWRKGNVNVVNGANISGAQTATLSLNPATITDQATNYNVIVTGSCGSPDTSVFAALVINSLPVITTEPTAQTVCTGATMNMTVVATGTGLTYQWRKGNVNLLNAGTTSGVNSATLVISPVSASDIASNYDVIVFGSCLPNDTSVSVAVNVSPATAIATEPISQTVCAGASVNFAVVATGSALTYQWRKGNVNIINGGNISGAQSATLFLNNIGVSDQAANYNVIVNGGCGAPDTSVMAALVVNSLPVITTEPIAQTVCAGVALNLTVAATGTGLNYQWRKGNVALANGGNVSGVNTPTLTINPIVFGDAAANYNVIVTGSCLPADTSIAVAIVVNTAPVVNNQPAPQTVCAGAAASFTVSASGSGLTYQWRRGTLVLANTGAYSGVTTPTLSISTVIPADAATDYNVVITGTCTPPVTSNNVALVVNTAPVLVSVSASQTVCAGSSVSITANTTGSGLFYQWRRGIVNLSNTGNITGANSATLTFNPVTSTDAASDYNVVVSGTCAPSVASGNIALTVNDLPGFQTAPTNQTICNGGSVSFTSVAVGSGISYQWFRGTTALVNGGNLSGTTTNSLTINPATMADAATDYYLVVTGICAPDARSADVSLTIENVPFFITQPKDTITCIGCSVAFSVTATGDGLSYQWRRGTTDLVDGGHISGANTNTLVLNPANLSDNDFNYNVVVSGNCGLDIRSDNASLLVCIPIGIEDISGNEANKVAVLYPNPFSSSLNAVLKSSIGIDQAELVIYNTLGVKVIESVITQEAMNFDTYTLQAGVYYYRVISKGDIIQTGKLISHK